MLTDKFVGKERCIKIKKKLNYADIFLTSTRILCSKRELSMKIILDYKYVIKNNYMDIIYTHRYSGLTELHNEGDLSFTVGKASRQ